MPFGGSDFRRVRREGCDVASGPCPVPWLEDGQLRARRRKLAVSLVGLLLAESTVSDFKS